MTNSDMDTVYAMAILGAIECAERCKKDGNTEQFNYFIDLSKKYVDLEAECYRKICKEFEELIKNKMSS